MRTRKVLLKARFELPPGFVAQLVSQFEEEFRQKRLDFDRTRLCHMIEVNNRVSKDPGCMSAFPVYSREPGSGRWEYECELWIPGWNHDAYAGARS